VPPTPVTASLKVAVTAVPGLTFPAPFAGAVELTVGGVVSVGGGAVTVMVTEGALTSPWFEPELFVLPNQAAVNVCDPAVAGAVVLNVIGYPAPPPLPPVPELLATSTLSR
jgi:hypothetical protein